MEFILEADGKEIWHSKPIKKSDGAVSVRADLRRVQKLKLIARRPEGQSGRAHANWVDAKLYDLKN